MGDKKLKLNSKHYFKINLSQENFIKQLYELIPDSTKKLDPMTS